MTIRAGTSSGFNIPCHLTLKDSNGEENYQMKDLTKTSVLHRRYLLRPLMYPERDHDCNLCFQVQLDLVWIEVCYYCHRHCYDYWYYAFVFHWMIH